MANNRMWLVNRALGKQVLLAKWWGVKWSASENDQHPNLRAALQAAFDADPCQGTKISELGWAIEYESDEGGI